MNSKEGPKTTPTIGPSDKTAISLALRIPLMDLAGNCSFCQLLANIADFFAPLLRHEGTGASCLLDMEEDATFRVELTSATMESETVAQLFVYVQVCTCVDFMIIILLLANEDARRPILSYPCLDLWEAGPHGLTLQIAIASWSSRYKSAPPLMPRVALTEEDQ